MKVFTPMVFDVVHLLFSSMKGQS